MKALARLRRAVSIAGRHVVLPRRMPKEIGGSWFLVSTEGGLKYLHPRVERIEPELITFARRFTVPGSTVWDVGANLGYFAFAAAGLAGPTGSVVAIEPDTWLCNLLRNSSRLNSGSAPVDVVAVAVSDRMSLASFAIAEESRACNSLVGHGNALAHRERGRRQIVPTVGLDDLLDSLPEPHVLKLDVEHAESIAIAAAKKLVNDVRPIMHLEIAPDNSDQVATVLKGADYRLLSPSSYQEIDSPEFNTVAVPSEKLDIVGAA